MTQIKDYKELRAILQEAINQNGVVIPLSHRTEKGLEFFKATNGVLYTTMALSKDGSGILTRSNIRPKAPFVEIDGEQPLMLEEERTTTLEPNVEALLNYFQNTLLAFKNPNKQ
ncbi:hypothetical protein [Vibrio sp. 10N.239.312.D08]|uniref:hypothetical protein n=1 Tax=Vibrio sp. 10N.239.312.D08 TaxID=3229978 RepID=UPI00354B63D5